MLVSTEVWREGWEEEKNKFKRWKTPQMNNVLRDQRTVRSVNLVESIDCKPRRVEKFAF